MSLFVSSRRIHWSTLVHYRHEWRNRSRLTRQGTEGGGGGLAGNASEGRGLKKYIRLRGNFSVQKSKQIKERRQMPFRKMSLHYFAQPNGSFSTTKTICRKAVSGLTISLYRPLSQRLAKIEMTKTYRTQLCLHVDDPPLQGLPRPAFLSKQHLKQALSVLKTTFELQ